MRKRIPYKSEREIQQAILNRLCESHDNLMSDMRQIAENQIAISSQLDMVAKEFNKLTKSNKDNSKKISQLTDKFEEELQENEKERKETIRIIREKNAFRNVLKNGKNMKNFAG